MSAERYGVDDEYPPHIPYVLSSWGYYDALDGEQLEDGDVVEIVWCDGATSTERVVVEERDEETRAYVMANVRGSPARIRLVDAKVKSAVLIKRALSPYEEAYNQVRSAIEKRRAALKERTRESKP